MGASHRARGVRVGLMCALLGAASCGPLPLESAYDTQRGICADPELFEELLEECRARWQADASCGGVLGFAGQLQGTPVIVESELLIARFAQVERLAGGAIERGNLQLTGRSPYFEYTFSLKDIGGDLLGSASTLEVGPSISYDDEIVEVALRLATGAESDDIPALSGQLLTEVQGLDEHVASFVLEFEGGDAIEGCFHALATESTIALEEPEEQGG